MNFYLVLAIALGAITGVAQTPVSRPALVATRAIRAQRVQEHRAAVVGRRSSVVALCSPTTDDRRPTTRGNTAPRAPAAV